MKFSIVSVSVATQQGNWFEFGPGTQLMVAHEDGHRVERAPQDAQSVDLVLEQGEYWLDCHDTLRHSGALLCPVRPAAKLVEAPDFEEGFLSHSAGLHSDEFPNPVAFDDGEAQRHTRAKHIPPTVSQREFDLHHISHLPFRSWCDHCVRGKAREDAHPSRPSPRNDPRVRTLLFPRLRCR